MKAILSERNIVVVLFVMVLVIFSLAQEDSKEIEKGFTAISSSTVSHFTATKLVDETSANAVDLQLQ